MVWWYRAGQSALQLVLGCTWYKMLQPKCQRQHGRGVSKWIDSDLVDPHLWHLQELGDCIHHADTCPALVLPLTKIEYGHHRCLLVLSWISSDDLLRSFHVRFVEFEGYLAFHQPPWISQEGLLKHAQMGCCNLYRDAKDRTNQRARNTHIASQAHNEEGFGAKGGSGCERPPCRGRHMRCLRCAQSQPHCWTGWSYRPHNVIEDPPICISPSTQDFSVSIFVLLSHPISDPGVAD